MSLKPKVGIVSFQKLEKSNMKWKQGVYIHIYIYTHTYDKQGLYVRHFSVYQYRGEGFRISGLGV